MRPSCQEIDHGCQRRIRGRQVDDLVVLDDADTAAVGPIKRRKLHLGSVSSPGIDQNRLTFVNSARVTSQILGANTAPLECDPLSHIRPLGSVGGKSARNSQRRDNAKTVAERDEMNKPNIAATRCIPTSPDPRRRRCPPPSAHWSRRAPRPCVPAPVIPPDGPCDDLGRRCRSTTGVIARRAVPPRGHSLALRPVTFLCAVQSSLPTIGGQRALTTCMMAARCGAEATSIPTLFKRFLWPTRGSQSQVPGVPGVPAPPTVPELPTLPGPAGGCR